MFCENCGAKLEGDDRFCGECGAKIEQVYIDQRIQTVDNNKKSVKGKFILLFGILFIATLIFVILYNVSGMKKNNADKQATDNTEKPIYKKNESVIEKPSSKENEDLESEKEESENEDNKENEVVNISEDTEIHTYKYFIDDCTWEEAFDKAIQSGGYLARINSREEYQHILSQINQLGYDKIQFRIGGRRDANSTDYYWVDENNELSGASVNSRDYWAFSEWMEGEPSYRDGDIEETYLDIYYYSGEERWVWNDVPNDIISVVSYFSGKIGYIVEYEN